MESEELFEIKLCKTKAACKVSPKKRLKLDLAKLRSKHKTLLETPILLVIKIDGEEVIVHDYGELLFKTLKDEKKIRATAKKIYEAGLK